MKQQEINKLLDEYRRGIISVENQRLLEQIAIEDDFVFDALQGMKSARPSSSSQSMDVLRTRLEDRVKTQKKRKILPFWIPGAAAAILVVVTVFWLLDTNNESSNDLRAVADASIEKEESRMAGNNEAAENESLIEPEMTNDLSPSAKPINTSNKPIASKAEKKEFRNNNGLASNQSNNDPSSPAPSVENIDMIVVEETFEEDAVADHSYSIPEPNDDLVMEDEEEVIIAQEDSYDMDQVGDLNTEYSPERTNTPAQASSVRKKSRPSIKAEMVSKDKASLPAVYKGIVTDQYGEPLIGANLEIKGTKIGVISDIDGIARFDNIPVKNPRIIVSYTGYNTVEIPLQNDFKVQLQEGAILSEVVVVGYGNTGVSEPEIGWDKFNNLVNNQLENIVLNQEQKNEIIQVDFTVGQDGVPMDIEIIKGKGNPKVLTLIQLIKTSGKWSSGKGSYSF